MFGGPSKEGGGTLGGAGSEARHQRHGADERRPRDLRVGPQLAHIGTPANTFQELVLSFTLSRIYSRTSETVNC